MKRAIGWGALPFLAVAAGIACTGKDGLADDRYRGTPLAQFNGVLTAGAQENVSETSGVSIVWSNSLWPIDLPTSPSDPDGGSPIIPPADGGYPATDGGPPRPDAGADTSAPPLLATECAQGVFTSTFISKYVGWTSQAVTFQAEFPTRFKAQMPTLPPTAVQLDLGVLGGTGKMAVGALVAFNDGNANGVYDLGRPNDAPDKLFAASFQADLIQLVVFLDGTYPHPNMLGLPAGMVQGFNLIRGSFDNFQVLAPDESVLLDATRPHTNLEYLDCNEVEQHGTVNGPPPAGSTILFCDAHARSYR